MDPAACGGPSQPCLGGSVCEADTDAPEIWGAALGMPRASPLLPKVRPHCFLQGWGGRGRVTPWSRFLSSQNPAALNAGAEHRAPITTWGSQWWGFGGEWGYPKDTPNRPVRQRAVSSARGRQARQERAAGSVQPRDPCLSPAASWSFFLPSFLPWRFRPSQGVLSPRGLPDQPCCLQALFHDSSCPAAPS